MFNLTNEYIFFCPSVSLKSLSLSLPITLHKREDDAVEEILGPFLTVVRGEKEINFNLYMGFDHKRTVFSIRISSPAV